MASPITRRTSTQHAASTKPEAKKKNKSENRDQTRPKVAPASGGNGGLFDAMKAVVRDASAAISRQAEKESAKRKAKSSPKKETVTKPPRTARARELANTAKETREGRTWNPDSTDLTKARNAHHSNTPKEMEEALRADHNWLEGDLRLDNSGQPVMAHDADKENQGLSLDEWLAIGGAGERGMKVDVKEAEAIPQLLNALKDSGIEDGRIMINVATTQVDEADLKKIREQFPDAWLAINPRIRTGQQYRSEDLAKAGKYADAAGGRVTFPIRWDMASDTAIEALRPHGKVSIWTSTTQGTPKDSGKETANLRARGVDGVIDLGKPLSNVETVIMHALNLWESDASRGAQNLASDAWDAGTGLASDAWDAGAGLIHRIPGFG